MQELGFTSQHKFASELGYTQPSLSTLLRKTNPNKISDGLKSKLELVFKVNINWLETGNGDHFLKDKEAGVPYYNIDFFNQKEQSFVLEQQPEYFVNYQPFNDCTAYVNVYGDSMYPRYASGEVIAVKEIKNLDVIQWGEAYVVIANEKANGLRTIKTIHEHPDQNKLILRSSNPNFKGETVLNKTDILSLYLIRGKITRNMI